MNALPRALLVDLDGTILRYGVGGEGLWAELLDQGAAANP